MFPLIQQRDRLAIMPGGKYGLVRTVVSILTFVAEQQCPVTTSTVGQYIGRTFAFDNHRLNEPLWPLETLGLVVIHDHWVHLTRDGRRLIKARPEDQELAVLTLALAHFPAVREILQLAVTAEQGFTCGEAHQQITASRPTWKDPELTRRPLTWLLSTHAVRERSRTALEITPRGRKAFADYLAAHPMTQISVPPPAEALSAAHIEAVITELNEAQRDSTHPRRFEEAAAAAMRVFGYSVERVGGSGKTDVVVDAPVNGASYRFIVDAKTCASGAWGDLNPTVLWQHAVTAHAQAVVVLAAQFAAGHREAGRRRLALPGEGGRLRRQV